MASAARVWGEEGDAHHHVHPAQLRPHLERHAERDTACDAGLDEVGVGLGTLGALKGDLLLDLGELELHERMRRVAAAVQVREDLERLLLAAMASLIRIGGEGGNTHRSRSMSQRGDSGKKSMPTERMMAGIIWRPHGIRKEALPLMYEQPNSTKYWRRMPQVMDLVGSVKGHAGASMTRTIAAWRRVGRG